MIKIKKRKKPQCLLDNAEIWTKEYLSAIESGGKISEEIKNRYNRNDIKDELEKETYGKCAYCESKIKSISFGDIEHILPKNKDARPDLYVEWSNLTIACEVCNRENKKDYYKVDDPLINPVDEDPNDYLKALGPLITYKPGNRKGQITTDILKLNRSELIEKRTERIRQIMNMIDKWAVETNKQYKDILAENILKECTVDKEYSFVIKEFVKQSGIVM